MAYLFCKYNYQYSNLCQRIGDEVDAAGDEDEFNRLGGGLDSEQVAEVALKQLFQWHGCATDNQAVFGMILFA